jgi:hypothetical protein
MRCMECRRWWSGEPVNGRIQRCACGGELMVVDMVEHMETVPWAADLVTHKKG